MSGAGGRRARRFGENRPGRRPVGDFRRTEAPEARKRSEWSKNVAINSAKTCLTHQMQINSTNGNAFMLRLTILMGKLTAFALRSLSE